MAGYIERLQDRTASTVERERVLQLAEDEADDVLNSLSSDTARVLYRSLFEEPATASELASRHEMSVQNVHYHLTNLQESGLVEPVDTVYSEKGHEMSIYGPTSDPLVFVGEPERQTRIERVFQDVVAGIALLAVASLFVQFGAERLLHVGTSSGAAEPAGRLSGTLEPVGALSWLVFDVFEPGFLFFVGCLLVAAFVVFFRD